MAVAIPETNIIRMWGPQTLAPRLARIGVGCLILWACGAVFANAAASYHLGGGRNIGLVNAAGYSNLEADAPHGAPANLSLDLSLFLSGHFGRYLNPFAETEIDQLPLAGQPGAPNSGTVTVERLYDDLYLRPSLTLRVGKMLTPVGDWNLLHAPPLVWTVKRPLSTYYSFPEYVTGASLNYQGNLDGVWDVQLYGEPDKDAFRKAGDYTPRPYSQVAGVDVRYSWDPLSSNRVGLSCQIAHLPLTGGQQMLASLYGGFTTGAVRWSFQADVTDIRGSNLPLARRHEQGGYLQAVYRLTRHWFIVAQGERYQTREYRAPSLRRLLGIVYRPKPALSWKLDFLKTGGAPVGAQAGLYAAWAVLF